MKKLISFMLIMIMSLSWLNILYAQDTITKRIISEKSKKISTINGTYPHVSGNAASVNRKISQIIKDSILDAENSNSPSLSFSYAVKISGDITSFLITVTSGLSKEDVKIYSVVYDNSSDIKTLVDLTNSKIFGNGGYDIANLAIKQIIDKRPSKYNVEFKGINKDSPFYVEDSNVVFIFNKYVITTISSAAEEISLSKDNIKKYTLNKGNHFIGSNYKVRFIPLREVCENFGYTISFNNQSETIDKPHIVISKDNTNFSYLIINQNEYSVNNLKPIALEAPPIISEDGKTYVPISYFENILGFITYIENNGDIVFTQYLPE